LEIQDTLRARFNFFNPPAKTETCTTAVTNMCTMNPLFYEINKHQHFEFPHDDCDRKTTKELMKWWCRPDYFGVFIARALGGRAAATADTAELGAAWMRLKFAAEVCNPTLVLSKLRPKMKLPRAEEWRSHCTERYSAIDVEANLLLNAIMEQIVGNSGNPDNATVLKKARAWNSVFPTIRSSPLGEYDWRGCAPSDMSVHPYSVFLSAIWDAFITT
jgi:hypothetical protein